MKSEAEIQAEKKAVELFFEAWDRLYPTPIHVPVPAQSSASAQSSPSGFDPLDEVEKSDEDEDEDTESLRGDEEDVELDESRLMDQEDTASHWMGLDRESDREDEKVGLFEILSFAVENPAIRFNLENKSGNFLKSNYEKTRVALREAFPKSFPEEDVRTKLIIFGRTSSDRIYSARDLIIDEVREVLENLNSNQGFRP